MKTTPRRHGGWQPLITDYLQHLAAGDRSPETISLRRYHLRRLADEIGQRPDTVTTEHLEAWLGRDTWSTETMRSHRSSLCGFFRWLHATGQRADDPAALTPRITGKVGQPRPCPEGAVKGAVIAAGARERLMVALAAGAGLRRGEISRVRGDDLERDVDGWTLRVKGKGGRVRVVPISDDVADAVRDRGQGWTFRNELTGEPLTPAHVGKLISRLLPEGWTAHTLRHRFASAAYAVDRDIRAVQELLGHASVATTQIYTAVPDAARRRGAAAAASGLRAA